MPTQEQVTKRANELSAALAKVNELRVPVMSRDRACGRKEQARLARELFKTLGLKGLMVRKATGAWCFHVDVQVPTSDNRDQYKKNRLAIEEILARAFPRHDDQSDMQTDYFDFKWFVTSYWGDDA